MKNHAVTGAVPLIVGLVVALFLSAGRCAPRERASTGKSDALWPRVLDDAPERPNKHVQWLELGEIAPEPVAIHPEGHLVALETHCETIVYDLRSGERLHAWMLPTTVVQFSRDGRRLLTKRKGVFRLWDAERFVEIHRFTGDPRSWEDGVEVDHRFIGRRGRLVAALSDYDDLLAISNSHGIFDQDRPEALLLYSDDGTHRHCLPVPEKAEIRSARFVSAHRILMSYSVFQDHQRRSRHVLWDTETGEVVQEFPREETVKASPDGRWLASARLAGRRSVSEQSTPEMALSLWDAKTGELLRAIERSTPVRDFVFRPDGKRILAPVDRRLIEWDVTSGEVVFEGDKSEKPYATVFYSPDGTRRFATVETPNGVGDDVDHHLRGWNVATGRPLPLADYRFDTYNGTERLFFFPEGDRFVDLAASFSVRDVITGEYVQEAPKHPIPQKEAAMMPDGRKFLVGGYLTDAASGKQRRWSLPGTTHAFVQEGRTLFSSRHNGLFLIDVAKGTIFWQQALRFTYGVADAASSADAERFVVACGYASRPSTSRLVVIDPCKSDDPLIIPAHATAVSITPDHHRFVAASHAGIEERDVATGEKLATLWTPPGRVLFAHYNAQGTRVLVGGAHGHENQREPLDVDDTGWVSVIDTQTREVVALTGHESPVTTGAFSVDGQRCVTGSMDRTIRLWDSRDGRELHVFRGHLGRIHRVAYSPLGDRILSAAEDGAAFWDIAGVVDEDQRPKPLAKTFVQIESVDARNRGQARPRESQLFPGTELATKRVDPAHGTVDWPVIEVGDIRHVFNIPRSWLQRATDTRQVAPPRQPRKPDKLSGYEYVEESRDGRRRLYRKRGGRAVVVVDADGELLSKWDTKMMRAKETLSPSGTYLAISREVKRGKRAGEEDVHELTVYDAESGEALRTFTGIRCRHVQSMKIDPNEETILLQINNNSLELRDFHSGEKLAELANTAGGAGLQSRYSLDGRYILTSKYPAPVIHVRDPRTLEEVKALENDLPVRWYRLTPKGGFLLAGQQYADHRDLITKWELESGRRLWSHAGPGSLSGEFSESGRYYLTKSGWSTWALWDTASGTICCVVVHRTRSASHFTFNEEAMTLYLNGEDGQLLWSGDSGR